VPSGALPIYARGVETPKLTLDFGPAQAAGNIAPGVDLQARRQFAFGVLRSRFFARGLAEIAFLLGGAACKTSSRSSFLISRYQIFAFSENGAKGYKVLPAHLPGTESFQ
jgi:hypothetical protein